MIIQGINVSSGIAVSSIEALPVTSGLWAWYKGNGTLSLNGSNVSQWNDESGNNRHLAQATAGSQPLFVSSGLNGKPVVRFDGVDDHLRNAAITLQDYFTLFFISKPTGVTTGKDYYEWHLRNFNVDPTYGAPNVSIKERVYLIGNTFRDVEFACYDGQSVVHDGGFLATLDSGTFNAFKIKTALLGASKNRFYIGSNPQTMTYRNGSTGNALADQSTPTTKSPTNRNYTNWTVGGAVLNNQSFYSGGAFQGDVAEIAIFNRELNGSELSSMWSYFTSKYGI